MRNMSRIWTVLVAGVSLGITLLWAVPARADLLTNTGITWSAFTNLVDEDNPVDFLLSDYNFGGGDTEGVVFSIVFPGEGAASGLYAYVYQIKVKADPAIKGISIPFITYPVTVNNMNSFYISSDQPDTIGFGQGSVRPTNLGLTYPGGAVYDPYQKTLTFNFTDDEGNATLSPPYPKVSMLVGVFSPLPPTIDKSNMLDTGDEASAEVLVPSPEPSMKVLFGCGLMGMVGTIFRRRRKA